MAELMETGSVSDTNGIREAVCIHTRKIFDSCRDKDCVEDLRFYPAAGAQAVIDRAVSLKAGKAELLYAYIDVEPVGFNRGFFTVDVRYFYRVTADAFVGAARPVTITGLVVFDKRAILFGSEGSAKVFSSNMTASSLDGQNLPGTNLPIAVVEAVDPLILGIKMVDRCTVPAVLVDYSKGGRAHRAPRREHRGKASREGGLADTEVAVHRDKAGKRGVRRYHICQLRAESFRLGGGACCFFGWESQIRKVP